MKFGLDIMGFDQLLEELAELPQRANASIARTMNFVAQSTAQRAKNRIMRGGRSGNVYFIDGRLHQASAPGEPPANLSGSLVASIRYTRMTDKEGSFATAGSDLDYAQTLEQGGFADFDGEAVYIEARPFLLPSFEEAVYEAEERLKKEFEKDGK